MRIRTQRSATRLAGLPLLLACLVASTSCGSQQDEDGAAGEVKKQDDRAQEVSAAWDGSTAATQWRTGYHPMGDIVQLPEGGLHSKADKRAYQSRGFLLEGKLPATRPNGRVAWSEGKALTRPVLTADAAFKAIAREPDDKGPHLTVTDVKLAEMTLATSRGPAEVPAWLFTLDGYDTPLKRAAVQPSKLPKPPIGKTRDAAVEAVRHLTHIAADGRSVNVVTMHGSCDDGSTVKALETHGSVVLTTSVEGQKSNETCNKRGELQRVTVKLNRPLNDRVLLDAHTGKPIPYKPKLGASPSWS